MTDQFPGDGGDHHVPVFSALHQGSITSAQPDLGISGLFHNGLGQIFLALLKVAQLSYHAGGNQQLDNLVKPAPL